VLIWLYNRIRTRAFGPPLDGWDVILPLLVLSAYLSAIFAGIEHKEWLGAEDVLQYALLLWLVRRGGYTEGQSLILLLTIIVSTLFATLVAFIERDVLHTRLEVELHSVGHINHSTLYLAISLATLAALTTAYFGRLPKRLRIPVGLSAFVLTVLWLYVIVVSHSRASALAVLAVFALFFFVFLRRSRVLALGVLGLAVIAAIVPFTYDSPLSRNFKDLTESHDLLGIRAQIWNGAWLAGQRFPFFGVGLKNYSKMTQDKFRAWSQDLGHPYCEGMMEPTSHGHSLIFNTLAERGFLGLLLVLVFLQMWFASVACRDPLAHPAPMYRALWLSAAGALVVHVVGGLFNTTLHHEHAVLGVMLLGLWLNHLTVSGAPSSRALNQARAAM
jgi:O-antigen ligase